MNSQKRYSPLMTKSTNACMFLSLKKKTKNENWTDQDAREFTMEDIKAHIGIRMIKVVDPRPYDNDYGL